MTDNRTTELREKLTERGIEWRSGLEGVTFVGDWCFVEYDNGKLAATCEPVLTPEQAIAATLGEKPRDKTEEWLLKACNQATQDYVAQLEQERDELKSKIGAATLGSDNEYEAKMDALLCRLTNGKWSKSRAYDLDFMEQCINEEFEMLYAKESADVELGNGTLTAEQVMAIAGRHQPDYCSDTHVCFDWQAIADELNAVIGGGECEIKQHRCTSCDREINDDAYYVRVNLGNGAWTAESRHANFCPNCGAKVVSE